MKKDYATICILVLAIGWLMLGATPQQQALLTAVSDTRAASMSAVPSGHGVAECELNNDQVLAKTVIPRHRVEFAFEGADSLCKEYDPQDPKKLVAATLFTKGRRIEYLPDAGGVPGMGPIVRITPMSNKPPLVDLELPVWTYREFSRIPGPMGDEREFFTKWARQPYTVIVKDGSSVNVDITFPYSKDTPTKDNPGQINLQKTIVNFDMAVGGLISQFDCIDDWGVDKSRRKETDKLTMTWKRNGNTFIPVARQVEVDYELAGKNTGHAHSLVDFKEFDTDPLKPGELDLSQLHIPEGAKVTDDVRRTQYRYYDELKNNMLGPSTRPSAPATLPGNK